jgi:hypothetical protein
MASRPRLKPNIFLDAVSSATEMAVDIAHALLRMGAWVITAALFAVFLGAMDVDIIDAAGIRHIPAWVAWASLGITVASIVIFVVPVRQILGLSRISTGTICLLIARASCARDQV